MSRTPGRFLCVLAARGKIAHKKGALFNKKRDIAHRRIAPPSPAGLQSRGWLHLLPYLKAHRKIHTEIPSNERLGEICIPMPYA